MTLSLFAQIMTNGLSIGMLYVLFVLGLDLILKVTTLMNFAHGEFYMLGAYVVYFISVIFKLPFIVGLIFSGITLAVIGALSYLGIFQWVHRRIKPGTPFTFVLLASAMASIGLKMIASQAAVLGFGSTPKGIPAIFPQIITFGDVRLPAEKLAVIIFSFILMAILYLILFKTKVGKSMRAVTLDPVASSLQGINPSRTYLMGFAVGCGLVGITGAMVAPLYAITPEMGGPVVISGLMVMMLGGMGSYKGAIIGGIAVGLISSFGYFLFGGISEALVFIMIIVVLIFKPGGFFGEALD